MRRLATGGTALLLTALVAACGGGSGQAASGAGCVHASAAHRAYVVVDHGDGRAATVCVGFAGTSLGGAQAMAESGIKFTTQHFSFGDSVCSIQGEPAHYTQCLPPSGSYWSLWVEHGGRWQEAQTGYSAVSLAPGDALGWRYESETASPAPPPQPRI